MMMMMMMMTIIIITTTIINFLFNFRSNFHAIQTVGLLEYPANKCLNFVVKCKLGFAFFALSKRDLT